MINDNDQTIFEIFRYEEMPDIKAKPGIYAWYYQPRIEPNWSMDDVVEEISNIAQRFRSVSFTHLRAHETLRYLACRLLRAHKIFPTLLCIQLILAYQVSQIHLEKCICNVTHI